MPYITETDRIIAVIAANAPMRTGAILKQIIDADKGSEEKQKMAEGVAYYHHQHDILKRQMKFTVDNQDIEDTTASNNKLVHSFHWLLVEQKLGYLVGQPISFKVESESETMTEAVEKELQPATGEEFHDKLNDLLKGASNKGREFQHIFINPDGEFDSMVVSAQECIPIFDEQYNRMLKEFIRYYPVTFIDGKGNQEVRYKAQWWTMKGVSYWVESESGKEYVLDASYDDPERDYHFKLINTAIPGKENGQLWPFLPWIEYRNNTECMTDLESVKQLIDDYNLNRSDSSNNLSDLQEAIYILKNYAGQGVAEFRTNLKLYKAIQVDGDGGVDTINVDIPDAAREHHVDRLKNDIYAFGQGVDMTSDKFGNNPTGVALQFLYSGLAMKCNRLERKTILGIRQYLKLKFHFLKVTGKFQGEFDAKTVTPVFNKTMITNTAEAITNVANSKGIISDKTAIANHPWVSDPAAEIEQMEAEREAVPDLIGQEEPEEGAEDE